MTTHLISILGLPQKNATSGDRTYRTATYRFQEGAGFSDFTTATFGMALAEWFGSRATTPMPFDRILWLGTTQSAWGSLLQSALGDAAVGEEIFDELYSAGKASPELVVRLAEVLSRATGRRHVCRIVPPCATSLEQLDFVTLLSGELQPRDRIVLDLTHGLRNQSLMLAQSALMLEGAFQVRIEGMFYGGLEVPREVGEPAPAVDLTGLLLQARLAQSLEAFRQGGDIRILAEHLPLGGFRNQIQNLGHAVAVHDFTLARNLAASTLAALPVAGVGALEPALREALESFRARSLAESQYRQAEAHLERKDFFRATLELYEGAITDVCNRMGLNPSNASDRLNKANATMRKLEEEDWKALEFLRNQMAHGVATDWHGLMQISQNPQQLESLLRRLLRTIPILAAQA